MISQQLLATLVCPETGQPLRLADAALLDQLNRSIRSGTLENRGGGLVDAPLDHGLVRLDGRWLYPIVDGIPVMLVDEAIGLEAFGPSQQA